VNDDNQKMAKRMGLNTQREFDIFMKRNWTDVTDVDYGAESSEFEEEDPKLLETCPQAKVNTKMIRFYKQQILKCSLKVKNRRREQAMIHKIQRNNLKLKL
jgi:hypothetical protein